MSIHELHFDRKGNVQSSRCLDREIQAATDGTSRGEGNYPSMQELTPVPMHLKPSKEYQLPKVVRKITAISKTSVREEEFVMAFNDGQFTRVKPPSHTYVAEEINDADLRIGRIGYAYSETEVYVAPKKHYRIPVISKIINHFTAA
ncbi:MAG TPA: hypothetical protein VES68_01625 [Candidatus Sulfotelmatobacter sp.]|nr:hypothetical protein [Candidatus Sulfotelmatobacter sp.]